MKVNHAKRKKIDWGDDAGFTGPQHYFRESLIIQAIGNVHPVGQILDVGCGGGSLLIRLGQMGYSTIGIDESKGAIDFLKKTANNLGLSQKIRVNVGNADHLPCRDHSVSVAIAGELLEHINNDVAVLKEISRVLIPGGAVVITVPAHSKKYGEIDRLAGHVRRYDKDELEMKISKAGLQISEIFYWGFPLTNFWQQYVLFPFIKKRLTRSQNAKHMASGMRVPDWIIHIGSYIFAIDLLSKKTSYGDCLFALAVKKK